MLNKFNLRSTLVIGLAALLLAFTVSVVSAQEEPSYRVFPDSAAAQVYQDCVKELTALREQRTTTGDNALDLAIESKRIECDGLAPSLMNDPELVTDLIGEGGPFHHEQVDGVPSDRLYEAAWCSTRQMYAGGETITTTFEEIVSAINACFGSPMDFTLTFLGWYFIWDVDDKGNCVPEKSYTTWGFVVNYPTEHVTEFRVITGGSKFQDQYWFYADYEIPLWLDDFYATRKGCDIEYAIVALTLDDGRVLYGWWGNPPAQLPPLTVVYMAMPEGATGDKQANSPYKPQ